MTDIVNEDIRWGLFGLTINENWISSQACDLYGEDYDLDADLDETLTWEKENLLRRLISDCERAINWKHYFKLEKLIDDAIKDYATLFPEKEEIE